MVDLWRLKYFAFCSRCHEKEFPIRTEFQSSNRVSEIEMCNYHPLSHIDEKSKPVFVDRNQCVAIRRQDHFRNIASILERECHRYIGCQIEKVDFISHWTQQKLVNLINVALRCFFTEEYIASCENYSTKVLELFETLYQVVRNTLTLYWSILRLNYKCIDLK